jgi:hypothetical protein
MTSFVQPVVEIEPQCKRVQVEKAGPRFDPAGVLDFGILSDPASNFVIVRSGCDELFKLLGIDLCESKKDLIHRTVEMIVARLAHEFGPAFIQRSCG